LLSLPAAGLLTTCVFAQAIAAPAEAPDPPNVVLIISDDQGWTDYGFMGHATVRTPNLDRLASQAALFSRGYVPTSLCRPSLSSIITGLYPHQHGITGNDPRRPDGKPGWTKRDDPAYLPLLERLTSHIDGLETLPRLLGKKGYLSHQSGKWWEGSYSRGGFTHGMTHGEIPRGGRHGDEGLKIGREGLQPIFDFLDAAGDRPFFLWYAPFMPHTPHNPPERLLAKYRARVKSLHLAKYYAMCEWFDETCGQLLDHLDAKGLAENTLVAYVCDNGWVQRPDRGGHTPRSKRSPYDGGVRTPILLRWPGKIPPGRHEDLVSSIDLAPTILSDCGIEPPGKMSGANLLDVCAGKRLERDTVYGEIFEHDVLDIDRPAKSLLHRWTIEGRWKLIVPAGGKTVELFDLQKDPFEHENLSARHPEIVSRLRAKLDRWWKPGGGG
jgi:uncharacterized sulfatase